MNELNEIPCEFFQPWSVFVMKTKIPLQYIELLIKITDEILEKKNYLKNLDIDLRVKLMMNL